MSALEERVEADLALGRQRDLVGELTSLVEQNPLRERVRAQLMLALYRSDRQAEALQVYQEFRRELSEQLGLDPGPGLQQLEVALLNRDASLQAPPANGSSVLPPDGSAAPDPELDPGAGGSRSGRRRSSRSRSPRWLSRRPAAGPRG